MKSTTSASVINALQVTELKVTNLPNTMGVNVEAVYALLDVDEKTKTVRNTHGRCTAGAFGWSEQTQKLLKSLLDSMEEDLLERHFKTESKEHTNDTTGLGSEQLEQSEETDQF